jgi:4-nitrophenyl phosphatase
MSRLKSVRALIIDMDGVLYLGDTPLPGLDVFFAFLREHDIAFQLATNNSTLTPGMYVEKMARMGVTVETGEILTSSLATADYVAGRFPRGSRVYAIGEEGLMDALQDAGYVLGRRQPVAVVVGFDRDLTYSKLRQATLLIRSGVPFIATNPDPTLPVPEGQVPGTGAILASLTASTGQSPVMIGKPEPTLIQLAMARMESDPETTAAIGDRPETDILSARRSGVLSILVLSGATDRARLAALCAETNDPIEPDVIVDDIQALAEQWARELER